MMTAEQLAEFFHESYERLAPQYGYETRKESAKPWAEVPEQNRKLMTAVCAEILTHAAAQLAEKEREIERLNKLFCDLTPGGSEFAGDPDYCAKYLRDRANTQTDLLKKKFIELRQREAELEQRWIAVGEKEPPKDGREVLLMVKYRAGIPNGKLVGHWQPGGHCVQDHPPIDAGWYFWNGRMFDQSSEPTHWQPLPSPPKEQP